MNTTRTPPVPQRGIESTAPMPALWLLARTLAALADQPPAREVVRSTWDELAELERTGQLPEVIIVDHRTLTDTRARSTDCPARRPPPARTGGRDPRAPQRR